MADVPADDEVLRIGVTGHGSAELTPATIATFVRAEPAVAVRLVPLSFQEHVSALVEHRVDVAFVRPAPVDDRIVWDVMTTESRILVTSRRSELAAAASVSVEEVLDLRYLDIPVGSPREFADFRYFGRARIGDRSSPRSARSRPPWRVRSAPSTVVPAAPVRDGSQRGGRPAPIDSRRRACTQGLVHRS